MVTEAIEKISRQLRDNAFDMSLIPLQSISVRFKRLIHDLSKSLDKEVELATEGLETVLDKNIIEKLVEPILHIIRNSMDHGIESKEERIVKSKNQVGTISIKASTIGSYVQIEIADDGKGLDIGQIRNKAVEKGFISDPDKLQENELLKLIFEPGFSTSELVTDVSGRGVGLDVVRRKIHEMRGTVEIESVSGAFTQFILKLPLSLSIIDGLLTRVGESFYVIPYSAIRKIFMVDQQMLKREFRQVVELEESLVPYLNIHEEFEKNPNLPNKQFAVTVSFANQVFALVVDEVLREYQAVIKPLGASILGNGQLALVLDTNKIIQKYS
jgi:two-component system chemotaxis sensor kinase CheA